MKQYLGNYSFGGVKYVVRRTEVKAISLADITICSELLERVSLAFFPFSQ